MGRLCVRARGGRAGAQCAAHAGRVLPADGQGIALEINRLRFFESVDPRSHRGESRWLFGPTL